MLRSIQLEDWKSFGSGERARNSIPLARLTLFVGPNASGKSNVLDALRFLQGAALDLPLGDVLRGRWEGQRELWPPIRGQVVEASRFGTHSFRLTTDWLLESGSVTHRLRVETDGDVSIDEEKLDLYGEYLFDTHAPALRGAGGRAVGGALRVALRASGKGGSPTATYSSLRSLLNQVELRRRVHPMVIEATHEVRGALRNAHFLDIRPASMRDYRPLNGSQLGSSGENVSPVLHALSEAGRLEDVVDWIGELCAPEIERIDFDVTQLKEVMMFFVEGGGRRVSARAASDGTLRFLGELVALLTAPKGALIVLEEPDVGLHPARIHLLAELLEQVAEDREIQVIATTHSPTLLAHLSQSALGNVVAFGRDPSTGWTICSRLQDLSHFATLRESKNLEHLVSTGWLERAL